MKARLLALLSHPKVVCELTTVPLITWLARESARSWSPHPNRTGRVLREFL